MKSRKPYERDDWDVCICAWCTNPFTRTKRQADRSVRYCSIQCAAYGRAVGITDAQYRAMAAKSQASRLKARQARLVASTAGLTVVEAYERGYRSGYSVGRKQPRRVPRTEAA